MAIIAALSVVNSKAGTKRFHECSWAISCKLLRSPEFADTPPDTAISEIPKSFAAITNLEVSEYIIAFCIEAAKSALYSSIKLGFYIILSLKKYKIEVFKHEKLKSYAGSIASENLKTSAFPSWANLSIIGPPG